MKNNGGPPTPTVVLSTSPQAGQVVFHIAQYYGIGTNTSGGGANIYTHTLTWKRGGIDF